VNSTDVRSIVVRTLEKVAPDVDANALDPGADFREELDLDSMDVLNLVVGLHEATGIEIPERDYPELTTVDACVAYLSERLAAA
jgi:acyl carrier protein